MAKAPGSRPVDHVIVRLTDTAGLGCLGSVVLIRGRDRRTGPGPPLGRRWAGLNAVAAFWSAYVITRPLGASLADWMAVGHTRGGLAWGLEPVTLAWTAANVNGNKSARTGQTPALPSP